MAKLNEQATCPHCHKNFTLSEVISHDLELEVERRLEIKYKTKEDAQKLKIQSMENERLDLERQKEKELLEQRKALEADLARKIEQKFKTENIDLKNQIEEERKKVSDAQKREVDIRKQQRELEEKTKQINLEMQRRLDDERGQLNEKIKKQAQEEYGLVIAAKDKQLHDMKKTIDDLDRKYNQTSQQHQGEVFELHIENKLKELFQDDDVKEVKKGARGADIVLTVKMPSGRATGSIVFECKNVKEWSPQWITKLKKDLRENGHDLGVIVTTALPKSIDNIGVVDGIWICSPAFIAALATLLRDQLLKVTRATMAAETPKDQKDLLFKYMTSNKFSQKIQGICEQMQSMTETLSAEKRALQKNWKKREQEIESMSHYLFGFYGELEGLVGKSLPKLELLELNGPDTEE